jgi:hypothetical protein
MAVLRPSLFASDSPSEAESGLHLRLRLPVRFLKPRAHIPWALIQPGQVPKTTSLTGDVRAAGPMSASRPNPRGENRPVTDVATHLKLAIATSKVFRRGASAAINQYSCESELLAHGQLALHGLGFRELCPAAF